jgi:hypothetical protein
MFNINNLVFQIWEFWRHTSERKCYFPEERKYKRPTSLLGFIWSYVFLQLVHWILKFQLKLLNNITLIFFTKNWNKKGNIYIHTHTDTHKHTYVHIYRPSKAIAHGNYSPHFLLCPTKVSRSIPICHWHFKCHGTCWITWLYLILGSSSFLVTQYMAQRIYYLQNSEAL